MNTGVKMLCFKFFGGVVFLFQDFFFEVLYTPEPLNTSVSLFLILASKKHNHHINGKNEFFNLSFYDPFWILLLFPLGLFLVSCIELIRNPMHPFLKCPVPSSLISCFLKFLYSFSDLFFFFFGKILFFNSSASLVIIFSSLANIPNITILQRNSPVI